MFDQKTNNINFWKNKVIKRPQVDNFIPGKEKPIKYQDVNLVRKKQDLQDDINNYKKRRDEF